MTSNELFQDSFVSTKLYPPTWDSQAIQRDNLVRLASSGRKTSVFSIVAAAGSGKSTLMSQLYRQFENQGTATAWISLDPEDNSPQAYLSYFISALIETDATLSEADLGLQNDLLSRDLEAAFDILLSRISKISKPVAFFLDDFQHIDDDAVTQFMNRLIAHLPDAMVLVIGSRTRLPLALGRLRVLGSLREVDQEDLNFDAQEAAAFLRQSHSVELDGTDLASLHETTEGWAAGLQLAALALRRHKGEESELIRQFSGRDRDLTSYLAESVLKSQPESVRKFLLCTAPLKRMCPDLCQAVSDHPKCGEMLALIDKLKLFLIPLDRTGKWFRYHHLFSDFLQKLLIESEPNKYQEICQKAAAWCEREGQITEAIQYSLDAGKFVQAADLIGDRALTVSQIEGDHHTLLEWTRRLPERYHWRRPEIGLSRAWSCAFSRNSDYAKELTETLLVKLRDENDQTWKIDAGRRQALIYFGELIQAIADATVDRFDDGIDLAWNLSQNMPEEESPMIASAFNCVSYARLVMREFDAAIEHSVSAYRNGQKKNSVYPMVWSEFLHSMADIELGRIRSAAEHGARADSLARKDGKIKSFNIFMAALINAEIATQRCEFDQAEQLMEVGRTFSVLFGPVEPLLYVIRSDARICAWKGNMAKALERLEKGREIAMKSNYSRLYAGLLIEEATLHIIADRAADAAETIRRLKLFESENAEVRSSGWARGQRNIMKFLEARMLLVSGELEKSLTALSRLQYVLGSDAETALMLTLRAVKAVALWQLGKEAESVRELDKALAAASDDFCAYPVIAAGRGLIPVLTALQQRRGRDVEAVKNTRLGFEQWLMDVLNGENTVRGKIIEVPHIEAPSVESRDTDVLTFRELELLKMAETGLSNKKLAKLLFITEATVKWHMHNVYEKLGVGNRTAAAARAREMQLI
tara:strand:- start:106182 stop:108968 length:2787 start_codon:yes stop_codon:yes gene_type:complete